MDLNHDVQQKFSQAMNLQEVLQDELDKSPEIVTLVNQQKTNTLLLNINPMRELEISNTPQIIKVKDVLN